MSSNQNENKFDRFEAWLIQNGAMIDMLELREYDSALASTNVDGQTKLPLSETSSEEKKESPTSNDEKKSGSYHESDAEMRGVHARQNIAPNTVCMTVPLKCLVTVEMGQSTPIGQKILVSDLDLDAPKHIFLMIYVLMDRLNPQSFYQPYYDVLPKNLSNMPIFWNDDDLRLLQGSYILAQIADRNEAIEDDYNAICDIAPELADIATLEEFKWARMCVCSRNFGLVIHGQRTSAMVPHADMLNHYRPRETKWTYDEDHECFTITTLQTIPSQSQIYDSYGQKCNHRFLLNYGFAVESNVELDGFCPNEVPLEVSLSPTDPIHDKKLEFWCREDGPLVRRIRVCVSNNENTKVLMSFLRVVVATEEELNAICKTGGSSSNRNTTATSSFLTAAENSTSIATTTSLFCGILNVYRTCRDVRFPISLRNERAALEHLLCLVRQACSMYPTTLDEDNKALSAVDEKTKEFLVPLFSNTRHALIQVRGEKEVLKHYEDLALTAIALCEIDESGVSSHSASSSGNCDAVKLPSSPMRGSSDINFYDLDKAVDRNEGVALSSSSEDTVFDQAIRNLERDAKHHTIIRYCTDVLGAARREAKRKMGRNQRHYQGVGNASRRNLQRRQQHSRGFGFENSF
mmetsp:Transcript_62639/g.75375  ORF Transcript_62639/g.75375 Transcript_62639/m.75375 type:complete len:633 (-) Transcript_62639:577-2475(-)|eukprot:CAMPEP_0194359900 /NCGR_PEP_ID=MMETSP0174-20130528/7183_1 /TAXON_ID=216777 /ORGANISM="Proboscia alata, Strain PI-D3" /LENGTH=632 /DNA_ID=CAMNT_0039131059 /DNA_START=25 /DNA_END=1923 /DNA_ORIENTATION=-